MAEKGRKDAITVEDLVVITSNQNFYTRSVVAMAVDFLETLFVSFVIMIGVVLVDCFVVAIALSTSNPVPALVITAVISVLIVCVAIAVPIQCFKKHAEEIGGLHEQCTELEASRLGRGQGEADGEED